MASNAAEANVLASAEVPEALEAEAFRTIYPKQFFQRFLDGGFRPDGRETAAWRDASLGARVAANADGSCLSKLGNTSVLAGVKLEVMVPDVDLPDRGKLVVHVNMAGTCSSETRPGKTSDKAQDVAADVVSAINACDAVDLTQMCIVKGQAAWVAYLDLYCLEDDGSVFDASLLAAMGALHLTELPAVRLDKGMVSYATDEDAMEVDEGSFRTSQCRLKVDDVVLSGTVGFYHGHKLFDPTHEEELLLESSATVALNEAGKVVFFRVPGGSIELDEVDVLGCIEAARRRYRALHALLETDLGRPPLQWE
uniref:Ribosomal RNA-processing protein 43 n=1 Tax=Picocystis salinarum TaxID=88271 RepID=A0A6U9QHF6_9CHLO